MPLDRVPAIRVRPCNTAPPSPNANYVLYWMIANRRLHYNFALDRALEHCRELRKPLVILEALRCGYRWTSERFHRFVLEGMVQNAAECEKTGVRYFCYVEPKPGAGSGLLAALGKNACVIVTDDYPALFLPRMVESAAQKATVRLEAVDSSGLLPIRFAKQVFTRAFDFRRFLQRELPQHLEHFPRPDALAKLKSSAAKIPREVMARWPEASAEVRAGSAAGIAQLPINHSVCPAAAPGGHSPARKRLLQFLTRDLQAYAENRNDPDADVTSRLSPYLHFGHISAHEIFQELAQTENWNPASLPLRGNGAREGWWRMSRAGEGFLDELITWRELGLNFACHRADYDRYESLPPWAQKTLNDHARDEREHVYSLDQFERAQTHDQLWNAAQTELVTEGRIHNYLRMLWGKKILEWTRTPQLAAEVMIELNNKYAVDGRDPNSYSGIFWVLGRYDRPWGPERPIFGTVRYMSLENTARKLRVQAYLRKYACQRQAALPPG